MKKMTLLEMVQNIASALETDEVNSITDTTESLQIAEVIKETFYELFTNTDIPEMQGMVRLESVSSLDSPNYLKIPDGISKINSLRYKEFTSGQYFELKYVNPEIFIEHSFKIDPSLYTTGYVSTVDPDSGITYYVANNGPPAFYTIFGDKYVAFNSFDSAVENTVQGDNSIVFGQKNVEFNLDDAFVPPLDANLFPLLLAESKSVCFINQKQITSSKEEIRARRQKRKFQREKFRSKTQRNEYWNRGNNFARNR